MGFIGFMGLRGSDRVAPPKKPVKRQVEPTQRLAKTAPPDPNTPY